MAASTIVGTAAWAADDDDALSLQSDAPQTPAAATVRTWRLYAEGAIGVREDRYADDRRTTSRGSLDFSLNQSLGAGWRLGVSDRLDAVHPVDDGAPTTVNSLRELYLGWQDADKLTSVDVGRVNLRNGPAYGFNPTDYFRSGALRSVTSADPLALRENRLGTVMLRAQRLWGSGAITLALAPKLADGPSTAGFSADVGATNDRRRALLSVSQRLGDRVSGQALWFAEQGHAPQFGLNATALLSDALVMQGEWSHGRFDDTLAQATGVASAPGRDKVAVGLTYTAPTRTALTLEYQYNAAAPGRTAWDAAAAGSPDALVSYFVAASSRQDTASRGAWLLYVMQKGLGSKNLDLTGLWRRNSSDGSTFTWVEARYHWPSFDAALQWQAAHGKTASEYGILPGRQWLQLLGAWYF